MSLQIHDEPFRIDAISQRKYHILTPENLPGKSS